MRNCNFINNTATQGAGVWWGGTNGIISSSKFTSNTATGNTGGAIQWGGTNGTVSGSTFIGNTAGNSGGGIWWRGANSSLINSTFINNTVRRYDGAGVGWSADYGKISNCIFINNMAPRHGGAIYVTGVNCKILDSTFNDNSAQSSGAIYWYGLNGLVTNSKFINNTATTYGGAILWLVDGFMNNCSFFNSKSYNSNGIYTEKNLTINGGKGIVYIAIGGTLSGISIVVLNNETYYYPPNSNINLTNKKGKTQSNETYRIFNRILNYYSYLQLRYNFNKSNFHLFDVYKI